MRGAILNPIRFYDSSEMPDYSITFPNLENVTYGFQYGFGVSSSPDVIRRHIGIMYLQFLSANSVVSFKVYKLNSAKVFDLSESVSSVDISPSGWTGYQIHKLTLDLDDGVYYVTDGSNYTSDIFQVVTSSNQLIKIKYSNSVNDFGCIFATNYFEAYFTGKLIAGEPKNEVEAMESDRGAPIKLKSTPSRTASLTIYKVSHLYKDLLDMIFSCDTIEINGISYENSETISWEQNNGGDIGTATVKLVQKINDYYYG